MKSITLQSRVGADGVLKLEVPTGLTNTNLEVIVVLNPLADSPPQKNGERSSEALGWPPGFFEKTYGSLPDFPEIDFEGDYEVREEWP